MSSSASPCWKVFARSGQSKVECNICQRVLSTGKDGSTSSMKRHIARYHDDKFKELFPPTAAPQSSSTPSSSTSTAQPTISQSLNKQKPLAGSTPRAQSLTDSILYMICVDLQPLSIVEDIGFRRLMSTSEKRYVIPCRKTFRTKLIPELYQAILEKLRLAVKEHCVDGGTVCISTYAWSARTASSYVTYNLHIITSSFEMKAYNVGTFEFKSDHTADNLREHLCKAVAMCGLTNIETTEFTLSQEDFMDITSDSEGEFEDEDPLHDALDDDDEPSSESSGIESQQMPPNLHIYITTDNASNISKAVAESPYHHIKCFAHTINLAVQKGLAVAAIQRQLARVRQIVKYFRKSNKGKYALQVSTCKQ